MLKWYGFLGLFLIFYSHAVSLLKIQSLATWYFYPIWFGYILFVDSLVYKIERKSMISNYPKTALKMLIYSIGFWWFFELLNLFIRNW